MLRNLLKDTAGATAIEYGLIAALISIAAVGAFISLGANQRANMEKVRTAYESTAAA